MKVIKLNENDIQRIVKRVITEDQRNDIPKDSSMLSRLSRIRRGMKLSGDDLYQYVYDNYIEPEMSQRNVNDFIDEYAYYNNIIDWGIQEYLASEEPDLESEEYDEKFYELGNAIKDYWTPF